jgi:acyl-CoA reductase-like NAD-dependent aldehyde dehydrogenase
MSSTQIPLLINGQSITTPKSFPVISPITHKELHTASAASLSDADAAVSAASSAFQSWRNTKPAYRRELLFKVADLLEAHKDELSEAMKNECAADDLWAGFNAKTGADITRDVGGRLASVLEGKIPECAEQDMHALVYKDPYGVVLAIAPWYFYLASTLIQ